MRSSVIRRLLLSTVLLLQVVAQCTLLDIPRLQWTHTLRGGGSLSGRSFRKGNSIVVHNDGNLLFVTADDGSLHILDARWLKEDPNAQGDNHHPIIFIPEPVDGMSTECRSSVSVVEDSEGKAQYVLYGVLDVPIASSISVQDGILQSIIASQPSSRVLAVNFDGTLRWSTQIDGTISGSPLAGVNGMFLYVVHNVATVDNLLELQGRVSVIAPRDGSTSITAEIADDGRNGPFGPPSLRIIQDQTLGQVDILAFTTLPSEETDTGSLYVLAPSSEFEDFGGLGRQSYELKAASDLPFGAVTRPLLGSDGMQLWMTGVGSNIIAWTGTNNLSTVISGGGTNQPPQWTIQLETSATDPDQPLQSVAALSNDEQFLFVSGVRFAFLCLEAATGRTVWSDTVSRSVHLSAPKYFEQGNDAVVYAIESLSGKVKQFDALTGEQLWAFNCQDITGIASCQDAVEGDFAISPGGNIIYYADIFGKIAALEVGVYDTPSPTVSASQSPSGIPSLSPSTKPSGLPTSVPTMSPTSVSTLTSTSIRTSIPTSEATIQSTSANLTVPTAPEPSAVTLSPMTAMPRVPTVTPSAFDFESFTDRDKNGNINGAENQANEQSSLDTSWPIFLGAAVGGSVLVVCIFFLVGRSRRSQKHGGERHTAVTPPNSAPVQDPGVNSEVKGTNHMSANAETSQMSSSSSPGIPVADDDMHTPTRRRPRRKNQQGSPQTPQTLSSIDEEIVDDTSSIAPDDKSLADRAGFIMDNMENQRGTMLPPPTDNEVELDEINVEEDVAELQPQKAIVQEQPVMETLASYIIPIALFRKQTPPPTSPSPMHSDSTPPSPPPPPPPPPLPLPQSAVNNDGSDKKDAASLEDGASSSVTKSPIFPDENARNIVDKREEEKKGAESKAQTPMIPPMVKRLLGLSSSSHEDSTASKKSDNKPSEVTQTMQVSEELSTRNEKPATQKENAVARAASPSIEQDVPDDSHPRLSSSITSPDLDANSTPIKEPERKMQSLPSPIINLKADRPATSQQAARVSNLPVGRKQESKIFDLMDESDNSAKSRFGQSVRQRAKQTNFAKSGGEGFGQAVSYNSDSDSSTGTAQKGKPVFKRASRKHTRAKKEAKSNAKPTGNDPWSSFMQELSAAEENFFNPKLSDTESDSSTPPPPPT